MSDFQLFIDSIKSDSDGEIENKFKIKYLEMKDKDSWRPLHHACRYGRVELVKLLLSNHCEIDSVVKRFQPDDVMNVFEKNFDIYKSEEGYQPIHLACKNGHIDVVKILIDNKCDINACDDDGYQPIHLACKNGHIDVVKILIANKCNINASNKDEYQPIHLACENDHIYIVKILIANKCNINASNKGGYQPIHFACMNGNIDVVKILIANKCDINASTNGGYQPIHLACRNGNIDVVKILIANKCDINASIYWGYQPLHFACRYGHIDVVKILIANKCDINAYDKDGYQPIHLACESGHIDIVKILIANKCNISAAYENGNQPIHLACENGSIDVVKILIANKCDINASNYGGNQPIHFACENGSIDVVKILIANKCDINAYNYDGNQPIHLACECRRIDVVKILIANNCDMNESSKVRLVANSIELYCQIGCDHMFCRQSLGDDNFKKGEFIGSGAFGKVYKYKISSTNREIVIKRSKSNNEDRKNIEGNINKYSFRILHKNIVRYFGALEKSGKLGIYMEYMPAGSLKYLIDKSKWIENSKVIKFSKQILEGLKFIHSEGIVHRDIKPDNILLDHDETIKLTDFGLSKSLRPDSICETTVKTVTYCGTPNYMAPEVILGEPYDFPADIWSTGASIVHMITGRIPYYWLQVHRAMCTIETTKKIEYKACEPISETMQSFIDDLLTPEQSNRPSAEILLQHFIFNQ